MKDIQLLSDAIANNRYWDVIRFFQDYGLRKIHKQFQSLSETERKSAYLKILSLHATLSTKPYADEDEREEIEGAQNLIDTLLSHLSESFNLDQSSRAPERSERLEALEELSLQMDEREQKARFREILAEGYETVKLWGDDPVNLLQRCEWACEIDVPYDDFTKNLSNYHFRVIGSQGSKFPLAKQIAIDSEASAKELIQSRNPGNVAVRVITVQEDNVQIGLLMLSEWSLELGRSLTNDTLKEIRTYWSQFKHASQAFPLLGERLGLGGKNTMRHDAAIFERHAGERLEGPWLNFAPGEFGPFTRAFIGLVRVTEAGERIILPKDRYGNSGGMAVCNVAFYDPMKPMVVAGLNEIFPSMKVQGWSLPQNGLCAVLLAEHIDGKGEFWGAVLNFNTQRVCFPLSLSGGETLGKLGDMIVPGFGKFAKKLGGGAERQWREDVEQYSVPAYGRVLYYVEHALNGSQSGKL